jgi:hypothetical protein
MVTSEVAANKLATRKRDASRRKPGIVGIPHLAAVCLDGCRNESGSIKGFTCFYLPGRIFFPATVFERSRETKDDREPGNSIHAISASGSRPSQHDYYGVSHLGGTGVQRLPHSGWRFTLCVQNRRHLENGYLKGDFFQRSQSSKKRVINLY